MQTNNRQNTFRLLAALSAPLAHFSGCGWLTAGLTALVILPLTLLPKCWEGLPKPVALVQILWIGFVAGWMLPASAVYWPSDNDLVVPLTILALAAWTKTAAAPRIGGVLAFCIGLLAIPQAASGAAHLELRWLRPEMSPVPLGLVVALLLLSLPAGEERKKGWQLLGTGVLTLLLATLVQGVLSPKTAKELQDAFYQMSRTLGYLEPIAAVAMTLGWYAATVWLLQSAVQIGKNSGLRPVTATVLTMGTALGTLLYRPQLYGWFLLGFTLILWVFAPFLNRINYSAKK